MMIIRLLCFHIQNYPSKCYNNGKLIFHQIENQINNLTSQTIIFQNANLTQLYFKILYRQKIKPNILINEIHQNQKKYQLLFYVKSRPSLKLQEQILQVDNKAIQQYFYQTSSQSYQKKSFQKNIENNKENNPILSNNSYLDVNKSKTQLQIIAKKTNKCDYSVNLYEQNLENIIGKIIKELTFVHDELSSSDFIELQMIISKNINKLSGVIPKISQSRRETSTQQNNQIQKIEFLNKKIEDLKNQISRLKKEKTNLKEKIENFELKIEKNAQDQKSNLNLVISKETNNLNGYKQILKPQQVQKRLQKIIFSQSQIINNQCKSFQTQSNQMRLILKAQALKLQEALLQPNSKRNFKSQSFLDF